MPSRAVTSFLQAEVDALAEAEVQKVSMPSRAVTSFLQLLNLLSLILLGIVSMPSRAVTSFLRRNQKVLRRQKLFSVNALSGCYLISTSTLTGEGAELILSVNALSGCYLISTVPLQKPRFYAVSRACFCRYLSEYSDSNSFSCMLTIWTYLMRQIILLTLI